MTTRCLPPLISGHGATGPVLVDNEVTDRMDANDHMDGEGHVSPQPDNQTHMVSRATTHGEPEKATPSGKRVNGHCVYFVLFFHILLGVPPLLPHQFFS